MVLPAAKLLRDAPCPFPLRQNDATTFASVVADTSPEIEQHVAIGEYILHDKFAQHHRVAPAQRPRFPPQLRLNVTPDGLVTIRLLQPCPTLSLLSTTPDQNTA